MSYFIFEPQHNISDRADQTHFVKCTSAEAEVYAVFQKENPYDLNEEAEYLFDIPARKFNHFVRSYWR